VYSVLEWWMTGCGILGRPKGSHAAEKHQHHPLYLRKPIPGASSGKLYRVVRQKSLNGNFLGMYPVYLSAALTAALTYLYYLDYRLRCHKGP
jgi:hypothetical protein